MSSFGGQSQDGRCRPAPSALGTAESPSWPPEPAVVGREAEKPAVGGCGVVSSGGRAPGSAEQSRRRPELAWQPGGFPKASRLPRAVGQPVVAGLAGGQPGRQGLTGEGPDRPREASEVSGEE